MLITINGNNEIVFGPDEFKWLIYKYMGNEAAEYFGSLFDSADEAVSVANDKVRSDSVAFFDIFVEITNISEALDGKKVKRNKIAKSVTKIKSIINRT